MSWRAARGQALDEADKMFNKENSRIRARVEHPFGVVKHLWGYRKTRYRELARNAAQVYTLFALANFYRLARSLPACSVCQWDAWLQLVRICMRNARNRPMGLAMRRQSGSNRPAATKKVGAFHASAEISASSALSYNVLLRGRT